MKTVIVTGGSRGIGKNMVETLVKTGYNVLLNYNKSEEEAKNIKEKLKEQGYNNIEIFKADVSKREEVNKMIEFSIEKFKTIDILINNAGISQTKMFTDITQEDWNNMINNNLTSVFNVTQEVLKNMLVNKKGCIINISSVWGMVGGSCESHYSASKAGIDGLTKALAKELGPSNIRINSIAPGAIDTKMNEDLNDKDLERLKQETPLRKIGKTQDITKCVMWLIEDDFTTGQVISPNGGWIIN